MELQSTHLFLTSYVTVLDIFKLWHFIKNKTSTIRYKIKSSHYNNPNLLYNIALIVAGYSVRLCPSSPFPTQQFFSVKLGKSTEIVAF